MKNLIIKFIIRVSKKLIISILVIGIKKEKLSLLNDISPNRLPNQFKLGLRHIVITPRIIKRIPTKINVFPMFILKFTNNIKYSMIPFNTILKSKTERCHFFHGNGFPPNAYKTFLNTISEKYDIQSMLLRQFWENPVSPKELQDWDLFLNDLMQYSEENNIRNEYAIGHSIGGNLLLRSALKNKSLYKKIVLLDPTIFSPIVIYIWRILCFFKAHPLIKQAKNRRKTFNDFEEIFKSYRDKNIFSMIPDNQLNEYIYSIFKENGNKVQLTYDTNWERKMYLTSGIKDFNIWKNLNKLKIPTLIIIPEKSPVLRYDASKKISKNGLINIKILKDTTHLFPLEKPNETSEIIFNFFFK